MYPRFPCSRPWPWNNGWSCDYFCMSHDLSKMDWSCDQNYLFENGDQQPKFIHFTLIKISKSISNEAECFPLCNDKTSEAASQESREEIETYTQTNCELIDRSIDVSDKLG